MRLLLDECVPARLRKALPSQQVCTVSVFVLDALSNELPYLLPLIPELEAALSSHKQGNYVLLRAEA